MSDVIEINTGYEDAYIILYKTVKSNTHFTECYDSIANVYVQNEIGKIIDTAASSINENLKATEALSSLDRSAISME